EVIQEQLLEATHGPALAELRMLEEAIEVASSAVEAGEEGVRLEAQGYDTQKWKELNVGIKAEQQIPLFRKSGGKMQVVPIDPNNPRPGSMRDATADEIENGVEFASLSEFQKANA